MYDIPALAEKVLLALVASGINPDPESDVTDTIRLAFKIAYAFDAVVSGKAEVVKAEARVKAEG
jgi:hypothetical protein